MLLLPLQVAAVPDAGHAVAPEPVAGLGPASSHDPRPSAQPAEASEPTDDADVVVRIRRRRRTAAATRTDASVARQLPGTQGDAVRVVESLPGVGRASFGSGELIVWGAAPTESRIYVDGVPIPTLFHGSGLRSTLNGFFVGAIELTPGAYGAEYGRATAGMVEIDTAPLRAGLHGYASADVLDGSAAVSASLSREVTVAAGARYGWIDRLAALAVSHDALQYLTIPQYADYQARVEYRPSEFSRLAVFAFGSLDSSSNDFSSDDPARARSQSSATSFHRLSARYTAQTSDGARLAVSAWIGQDASAQAEQVGPYPSTLDDTSWRGGFRASWLRTLSGFARLHAGIDGEGASASLVRTGSLLRPPREGDVSVFGQPPTADFLSDRWSVHQVMIAPFVEVPFSFWDDRLTFVPGLRVDGTLTDVSQRSPAVGDNPTHGVAALEMSIEPRILVTGRPTEWLQLKAAAGLYHTPPRPEDLSAVFGTPTLTGEHGAQGLAGGTVRFSPSVNLEALGFVRWISDVAARAAGTSVQVAHALVNSGEARAYGAQVTLRATAAGPFTGWLSYTLQRSEVVDRPGADPRLSDYDQTHLVTAVGSVRLPYGFSVGARFRYLTGLPRTPVVGRTFDALTSDYQPVFGQANSDRLPPVVSADVRVDRRFALRGGELVLFLDVLNVLNRPIAEEVLWDPTFTRQGYITGLPILADLGVRGEW